MMYFHTDKGRTTVVVGFLLVCRCRAGKLEAGNGWRVSLPLLMVLFLGSGREAVVVDTICSCRGSKVGVFFFLQEIQRSKSTCKIQAWWCVPVILACGRLRQDVLHESEASLAT